MTKIYSCVFPKSFTVLAFAFKSMIIQLYFVHLLIASVFSVKYEMKSSGVGMVQWSLKRGWGKTVGG